MNIAICEVVVIWFIFGRALCLSVAVLVPVYVIQRSRNLEVWQAAYSFVCHRCVCRLAKTLATGTATEARP